MQAKNNLAAPQQGIAYRIEQTLVGKPSAGIVASRIFWEPTPVSMTADQAMAADAAGPEKTTAKDDAIDFLKVVLADGPMKVADLEEEARGAGLLGDGQRIRQNRPLRDAGAALGIRPYQAKGQRAGGWLWELPAGGQATSDPSGDPFYNRSPDPKRSPDPPKRSPDPPLGNDSRPPSGANGTGSEAPGIAPDEPEYAPDSVAADDPYGDGGTP